MTAPAYILHGNPAWPSDYRLGLVTSSAMLDHVRNALPGSAVAWTNGYDVVEVAKALRAAHPHSELFVLLDKPETADAERLRRQLGVHAITPPAKRQNWVEYIDSLDTGSRNIVLAGALT